LEILKGKILLIVEDANNTIKYNQYLKKIIDFDLTSSIDKAYDSSLKNYYDLILVDLKLGMGIGQMQLERFNSLSSHPAIVKIRPREKKVDAIFLEKKTIEELLPFLKKFFTQLKKDSSSFINSRNSVRNKSILRVIIKKDKYPEPLQANSLDISLGGLFITTVFPFKEKEKIKVHIYDAVNDPIQACMQIMWVRPWEVPKHLPGIGARFISFDRDNDQYNLQNYINNTFQNR